MRSDLFLSSSPKFAPETFFFVCLLVFLQNVAGSSRNKLKQRVLLWPDTEHKMTRMQSFKNIQQHEKAMPQRQTAGIIRPFPSKSLISHI